jgi:hypothetical protein
VLALAYLWENYNLIDMKKLQFIGAIALSMSLLACGGGDSAKTEDKSVTEASEPAGPDYSNMVKVDLTAFGVEASIQLPKEEKGPHKIENTATESITIEVSDKFGIEITPFALTVAEKKEELDGDLVYTIEYLEETENKIMYKKSIADSDEVEDEYHFFITRSMDGELYSIQSLPNAFRKKSVGKMLVSAESISPNKPS